MSDQFGTIVSRWQVEQAVISTLQAFPEPGGTAPRIVYYLAELERDMGLTARTLPIPPGPSSYRGGLDFNTLEAEWFPLLTVVAQPIGTADALTTYEYGQAYQIQVAATVGDDDEDKARMFADAYGAAVALAVTQRGSLGIGATSTALDHMPTTELLTPSRQVARSVAQFTTYIKPALSNAGPISWAADPYAAPGGWPAVQTTDVTVTAVPVTQQLD